MVARTVKLPKLAARRARGKLFLIVALAEKRAGSMIAWGWLGHVAEDSPVHLQRLARNSLVQEASF